MFSCRVGVSAFTLDIKTPAASGCTRLNAIVAECTGFGFPPSSGYGFLPVTSPGVLISTSAPNGVTLTAATLQGGYMDNTFAAQIVPLTNEASYILIARDGTYHKMVQVSNICYNGHPADL